MKLFVAVIDYQGCIDDVKIFKEAGLAEDFMKEQDPAIFEEDYDGKLSGSTLREIEIPEVWILDEAKAHGMGVCDGCGENIIDPSDRPDPADEMVRR